jgi:hypothetical protein
MKNLLLSILPEFCTQIPVSEARGQVTAIGLRQ